MQELNFVQYMIEGGQGDLAELPTFCYIAAMYIDIETAISVSVYIYTHCSRGSTVYNTEKEVEKDTGAKRKVSKSISRNMN